MFKNKFLMIVEVLLLVVLLSFFVINFKVIITGFAIDEDTRDLREDLEGMGGTENISITKDEALDVIKESEAIIKDIESKGFYKKHMEDLLIDANRILEQMNYADILNGKINGTSVEREKARQSLKLIDWEKLSYSDVLEYTDEIKNKEEETYLLNDRIFILRSSLEEKEGVLYNSGFFIPEEGSEVTEAEDLFNRAKTAFDEGRFEESGKLLQEAEDKFESQLSESSILIDFRNSLIGFWKKYWPYILFLTSLIGLIIIYIYKKLEKRFLREKIKKMKTEKDVLIKLIKKTQEDRFRKNSISGLIYNIRIKHYGDMTTKLDQELPVVEKRLEKVLKRRGLGKVRSVEEVKGGGRLKVKGGGKGVGNVRGKTK